MDRNLNQVSSIFKLTTLVMACGMLLIAVGIWRAISEPSSNMVPLLAAASGIIIQIIAGTFLIIYRSTMDQAKNYVVVLERINAVGMSINVIESIDGDNEDLKNESRAHLAKELLKLYPNSLPSLKDEAKTS